MFDPVGKIIIFPRSRVTTVKIVYNFKKNSHVECPGITRTNCVGDPLLVSGIEYLFYVLRSPVLFLWRLPKAIVFSRQRLVEWTHFFPVTFIVPQDPGLFNVIVIFRHRRARISVTYQNRRFEGQQIDFNLKRVRRSTVCI